MCVYVCVSSLRCSGPKLKSCMLSSVPVLSWLPRYSLRDNAIGDLISGISVGIMHLPQGMAYALLAAVPPVFGLYSSFYPILIYFIFGSSKHISVGTYAVMSVMIGGVTERLAPDTNFMMYDNATNQSMVNVLARDTERVKVAAAVTFLSGLFQMLLGLVKFGFVVTYLSEPLVRGYTTGAAIHVIVSQLKYTFGISPKRHSGPFALIFTVIEVCYLVPETNIGTLVVSLVSIIGLVLVKELNTYLGKKLPVPIPVELLGIIIATVVSWQVNLEGKYGVEVVGEIPSGLQPPVMPTASLFGQVIGDAFALSVVGYGIAISLGRIFALKYGYKVDSNQELIALGLSNTIGGVFQCFAISCSMSRTMVQESTGGKTQVQTPLIMTVVLCVIVIGGCLSVHQAVLAAIIYVNLQGMMKQFMDIPTLWKSNKVDMLVWVATLILTVLFNPDIGLAASIAFSMLTVIFRTQLPKYSLLGQVPETDIYRPVENYNQVNEIPGVVIFRSSATLYFANAEMYQDALAEKVRSQELLCTTQAYFDKLSKRLTCFASILLCAYGDITDYTGKKSLKWPMFMSLRMLINHNYECLITSLTTLSPSIPPSSLSLSLALSLSVAGVIENLESGGFFSEKVSKACLFSSIHDAVLHCQTDRPLTEASLKHCAETML
uniref:STAS domain-containing protein n=1 Tax=Oncorhynchus kisutch TaxID=8019 RepID=A0A8C7LBB7_ONCKI